ncbi:MAG: MFS transporter [Alphaproteobacteria bacterium]|nr:MFS transporter [Alphaproteobacteria bacterium]
MAAVPTWIVAIGVILVLQTTSAYLSRLVPIVAPAFMGEFGWDASLVGYLTAANIVGALFILTIGIGAIRQLGGVLALLVTLLIGAASLLLLVAPSVALALLASFLMGFSNGTANPSGSEVLQRYTPQAHRNFVFSIKQAGVPLGGVVAGLTIPPLVDAFGWRTALVVAAAGAAVATLLMWPFQPRIDPPRQPMVAATLISFRLSSVIVPLRSLRRAPGLVRIAWVGAIMAIAQSVWFTFTATYLVLGLGLSLGVAGLIFAVMQASGAIGRVMMGFVADRVASSTTTLTIAATGSGLFTILFGFTSASWPVWALLLLAAAAGMVVAGWNGVQIAEVAHRSPPELVAETAAGSVIMVFLSNMFGPVAFAAAVYLTGRYDIALWGAGACSLLCLPLLIGIDRKEGPPTA